MDKSKDRNRDRNEDGRRGRQREEVREGELKERKGDRRVVRQSHYFPTSLKEKEKQRTKDNNKEGGAGEQEPYQLRERAETEGILKMERLVLAINICMFYKSFNGALDLEKMAVCIPRLSQNQLYHLWFSDASKRNCTSKKERVLTLLDSWLLNDFQVECRDEISIDVLTLALEEAVEEESQFCIFVLCKEKPSYELLSKYYDLKKSGKTIKSTIKEVSSFPSSILGKLEITTPYQKQIDTMWAVRFQDKVDLYRKAGSEYENKGFFKGPPVAKAWYPFNLKYIACQFNSSAKLNFTQLCKEGEKRAGHCHCKMAVVVKRNGYQVYWPKAGNQRNCKGDREVFQKPVNRNIFPRKNGENKTGTSRSYDAERDAGSSFDANQDDSIDNELQSSLPSSASSPSSPSTSDST